MDKLLEFTKQYTKQNIPPLQTGDTVRVYERLKEGDKERVQVFEGIVIARKHGTKSPNATFIVRKISYGVGVEKTFPLHSPNIEKIEVVKHEKVRRAKLYYTRDLTKKKKKRKAAKMLGLMYEEAPQNEEVAQEQAVETPENKEVKEEKK